MKMSILGVFGILASGMLQAAPVFTVTLPSGVTNTLDQAIGNGYVSASEGSATLANLYTACDLRIEGSGRLDIADDLKSNGFTGEVHVVQGSVLRVMHSGALGDTTGGTFVEDGATLETYTESSSNNSLSFKDEHVTFAGRGATGEGALIACTTASFNFTGVWGTKLTMTGDALIAAIGTHQQFPGASDNVLDMNGHTLTVCTSGSVKSRMAGIFQPNVTNPGNIVISNYCANIQAGIKLPGGPTHKLIVAKNGLVQLNCRNATDETTWTIELPNAYSESAKVNFMQSGGVWQGPIDYGDLRGNGLYVKKNSLDAVNSSRLEGPIYAGDTARTFDIYGSDLKYGLCDLTLAGTGSTFAGGLYVYDLKTFIIGTAGAVPADVKSFTVERANIGFSEDVADYGRLPSVTVQGTGDVHVASATGVWPKIVKKGTGTLHYYAPGLEIEQLELQTGTFAYEQRTEDSLGHRLAGVSWGYKTDGFQSWAGTSPTVYSAQSDFTLPTVTNSVVRDFGDRGITAGRTLDGNNDACASYWRGYLMNNTGEAQTWRLASSMRTWAKLYVNGQQVSQGNNLVAYKNITLNPGPNLIDYRVSGSATRPLRKDELSNVPGQKETWTNGYGLAWCKTSLTETNSAFFTAIEDPGDGSVLRVSIPGESLYDEIAAAWSNEVAAVGSIVAQNGAVLDLGGAAWKVGNVTGPLTVSNTCASAEVLKSMTITNRLSLATADVVAGRKLTTDGRLVFEPGSSLELTGTRLAHGVEHVVATAEEGIVGMPNPTDPRYHTSLSSDGKTLMAVNSNGFTLIVR